MSTGGSSRDIGPVAALFLGVTLLLAGIHIYLGLVEPRVPDSQRGPLLAIGIAFLAGFIARLTPLWRPVLYLLGAAFAIFLGALWVFGGIQLFDVGVATGIVSTVFLVLALYLFVREESAATPTGD